MEEKKDREVRQSAETPDEALLQKIRDAKVEVPESLSPENVEAYLRANGGKLQRRNENMKILKFRKVLAAAAAILVVAILVPTVIFLGNNKQGQNAANTMSEKYTAAEGTDNGESFAADAAAGGVEAKGVLAGGMSTNSEDAEVAENAESMVTEGATFAEIGELGEKAQELIRRSDEAFAETKGGKGGGENAKALPLAGVLARPESYEDVKNVLGFERYSDEYYAYPQVDYGVKRASSGEKYVEDAAMTNDVAEAAPTAVEGDHSTTNLREANVDEGDVVKTDGKFIYQLLDGEKVRIVRADGGTLTKVSEFEPELSTNADVLDMFLVGDKLVLLTNEYSTGLENDTEDSYYVLDQKVETHVRTYELGDRTNPKEVGNVAFEGRYEASRVADGVVYVITDKTERRYYPYWYRNIDYVEEKSSGGLIRGITDFLEELLESFGIEPVETDGATSSAAVSSEGEAVAVKKAADGAKTIDVKEASSLTVGSETNSDGLEVFTVENADASRTVKEEVAAVENNSGDVKDTSKAAKDTSRDPKDASGDANTEAFNEEEFLTSGVVPKVNGKTLSVGDIYLPKTQNFSRSWLIGSVHLDNPNEAADAKLVCTDLNDIYVSANAIFLMGENEEDYEGMNVIRVDFADGIIRPTGAAYLPGTVDDSFSVSESADGHFRAAVTRGWNGTNSVFTFDKDMKPVGSLKNIIEGEEIKSARYIGDLLYLVTYRNTDPLFCVDLSDPTAPKLLGELKIPGFSEYLHPFGDGRLLGLGYETNPKTGDTIGTKLSLFDISDPANVKEISKMVLRNVEPTAAFENYKAILADPAKNLFGFAAGEAWWSRRYYDWEDLYYEQEGMNPVEEDEVEAGSSSKTVASEAVDPSDEEGEEVPEEKLAAQDSSADVAEILPAEGVAFVDESGGTAGLEYIDQISADVAEGLVYDDGTTEAVSERKETAADAAAETKGRTADVRMHGEYAYLLFSVENDEIVCKLVRSLGEGGDDDYHYDDHSNCRGLYIGDTFYIADDEDIDAFAMGDGYKVIGSLS